MILKSDIERLRSLGRTIHEISEDDSNEKNKKLWTDMNDLVPTRPLIHVRDYPIYMMEYENELTPIIEDEFLGTVEQKLLLIIYEWNHLKSDRVVEPYIECDVVFYDSGFGIESDKPNVTNAKQSQFLNSVHYEQQIFSIDDIEKIKTPVVSYNKEETMKRFHLLEEIFDGIIPVKLFGRSQFNCTPLDDIMTWTGIEQGMLFLALEPSLMHCLVDRYIDAQIARIKQYESLGILSSNNAFKNIGNNCIGYSSTIAPATKTGIDAKISDIWGENSDQIMTGVSKKMSEEFSFNHETKWASLFPLFSYGCCERLDNKVSSLLSYFPNIRKISSSPYSNLETMLEQVENKVVVSFKPNSNYLSLGINMDYSYLKAELENVCKLVEKYNANVVINMKTLITLQNEPWRLWQWCDLAREIVTGYFG